MSAMKDKRIYNQQESAFGREWKPKLGEYEIEGRKMLALEDLVAEQRTANLLAMMAIEQDHYDGPSRGLLEDIRTRLGLDS